MRQNAARVRVDWTDTARATTRRSYPTGRSELLGFLWHGAEMPNVHLVKIQGRYIVYKGRTVIETGLTTLNCITCGEWETRIRQGYFP